MRDGAWSGVLGISCGAGCDRAACPRARRLPARRGAHLQGHEALRQHFVEHLLGLLGRDHGEILHLLLLQVLLAQEQPEDPGAAGPEPERGGNAGQGGGEKGQNS